MNTPRDWADDAADAMMFKHTRPIETGHRLFLDPDAFKAEVTAALRAARRVQEGKARYGEHDYDVCSDNESHTGHRTIVLEPRTAAEAAKQGGE